MGGRVRVKVRQGVPGEDRLPRSGDHRARFQALRAGARVGEGEALARQLGKILREVVLLAARGAAPGVDVDDALDAVALELDPRREIGGDMEVAVVEAVGGGVEPLLAQA